MAGEAEQCCRPLRQSPSSAIRSPPSDLDAKDEKSNSINQKRRLKWRRFGTVLMAGTAVSVTVIMMTMVMMNGMSRVFAHGQQQQIPGTTLVRDERPLLEEGSRAAARRTLRTEGRLRLLAYELYYGGP